VHAGEPLRLRHARLGDLTGIDAGDAEPAAMDLQHDLRGGHLVVMKYRLEDPDDEFHGGVIVVVEEHLIDGRLLGLRLRPALGDDSRFAVRRRTRHAEGY